MILHVMKHVGVETDFMVGAQLDGFSTMVKFSEDAKYAVIEGDEYLASPIDRRPKFHLYHPNIAIISGIAWDHINVFPTFENYVDQFRKFIQLIEPKGHLIYCREDAVLRDLCESTSSEELVKLSYGIPEHTIKDGLTSIILNGHDYPLLVFGKHNLMNLEAARIACNGIGISDEIFYTAIQSFKGAAKRLELVYKAPGFNFYKDFAHSPSKLRATTDAVKQQFPNRKVIACMELHTFSSLTEEFLLQYSGSMNLADEAIVYFNPQTIEHKKLKPITTDQVIKCFNRGISHYPDHFFTHQFLMRQQYRYGFEMAIPELNFLRRYTFGKKQKHKYGQIIQVFHTVYNYFVNNPAPRSEPNVPGLICRNNLLVWSSMMSNFPVLFKVTFFPFFSFSGLAFSPNP